jgi:hypothetical protein
MESLADRLINIECKKLVGADLTIEEQALLRDRESQPLVDESVANARASFKRMATFKEGKKVAWSKLRQRCFLPEGEVQPVIGKVYVLGRRFARLHWTIKVAVIIFFVLLKLAFIAWYFTSATSDKKAVVTTIEKTPWKDSVITRSLENGGSIGIDIRPRKLPLQLPSRKLVRLILPDGSKVWLNAAANIFYPPIFDGPERVVRISGEVYFEVAENKAKPFIVLTNAERIRVYGTHFNVKAYDKEPTTVTLLEGSLSVVTPVDSALLRPRYQFVAGKGTRKLSSSEMEEVNGWQQELFKFHNTDIRIIMNEIARWYDKKVVYKNENRKTLEVGGISRNLPLEEVLNMLSQTGSVAFKLQGDSIEVEIPPSK